MMGELIFWGIVFVAALIAELASFQLVSIWFAVGAAGAFAASMMHMGFAAQLGTNADLNIGEKEVVIEDVDAAHGTGRVRLKGVDWMAISETGSVIPADTVVTVLRVEGSKLFVYPAEANAAEGSNDESDF